MEFHTLWVLYILIHKTHIHVGCVMTHDPQLGSGVTHMSEKQIFCTDYALTLGVGLGSNSVIT